MSIPNNPLAEIAMQDIVNADSARVTQSLFNTLFVMENMANFYVMNSSSPLACHYFKERKDSNIEDDTSQLSNDIAPG